MQPAAIPSTGERVRQNTAEYVNERIARRTDETIARCALAGREAMDRRLRELDREWDIERALEANAAAVGLMGVVLTVARDRRWIVLPGVVTAFLLQHAVQGWCPPVPIFRRLGFRTAGEIHEERVALKLLRGDFREVAEPISELTEGRIRAAIDAVRQ